MQKKYSTDHKGIDRRDFLKRFAILSVISLGASASCSNSSDKSAEDPVVVPVYGIPPYEEPVVDNMFYLLPDGSEVLLYDSEDVDVDSEFRIYFSDSMRESSQNSVVLEDGNNQPVPLIFQWEEELTVLKVTPETLLQNETQYTLIVNENALTAEGTPIQVTENAQAVFKTIAA